MTSGPDSDVDLAAAAAHLRVSIEHLDYFIEREAEKIAQRKIDEVRAAADAEIKKVRAERAQALKFIDHLQGVIRSLEAGRR